MKASAADATKRQPAAATAKYLKGARFVTMMAGVAADVMHRFERFF